MNANVSLGTSALPCKDSPTRRGRAARKGDHYDRKRSSTKEPATFELENSVVTLEAGPAGAIARIDRTDETDYAGPLPIETIRALREVANGC